MEHFIDYLSGITGVHLYLIVFGILVACGFGLPLPEDVTLIAAGVVTYFQQGSLETMMGVAFLGVMIGDTIIFLLGAHFGGNLTQKKPFSYVLTPDRLLLVRQKMKKHGNKLIFAARFMPGLRAPIYFSCGTLHVPFKVFLIYDGVAALLSVPAITYAAWQFGPHVIRMVRRLQHGILVGIGLLAVFLVVRWYLRRFREEEPPR